MPVYYSSADMFGQPTVVRVDDDGIIWWLGEGEQDPGYLAWLAEGNTPEPWEATNGPE